MQPSLQHNLLFSYYVDGKYHICIAAESRISGQLPLARLARDWDLTVTCVFGRRISDIAMLH